MANPTESLERDSSCEYSCEKQTKRSRRQVEAKSSLRRLPIACGPLGDEAEFTLACDMAFAYERKLQEFHNNKFYKLFPDKKFSPASRSYPHFLKAALEAQSHGIDFGVWVEAQFYWFNKWFGKPPRSWQLAGGTGKMPASKRATVYLEKTGLAKTGRKEKKVVAKLTKKKILAYNEKLLLDMMRDGRSEQDCLLEFGQGGMNVFHPLFLASRKIYRKLVRDGVIDKEV